MQECVQERHHLISVKEISLFRRSLSPLKTLIGSGTPQCRKKHHSGLKPRLADHAHAAFLVDVTPRLGNVICWEAANRHRMHWPYTLSYRRMPPNGLCAPLCRCECMATCSNMSSRTTYAVWKGATSFPISDCTVLFLVTFEAHCKHVPSRECSRVRALGKSNTFHFLRSTIFLAASPLPLPRLDSACIMVARVRRIRLTFCERPR